MYRRNLVNNIIAGGRPWLLENIKYERVKLERAAKILLIQSLIYNDLKKRAQRIYSAVFPL